MAARTSVAARGAPSPGVPGLHGASLAWTWLAAHVADLSVQPLGRPSPCRAAQSPREAKTPDSGCPRARRRAPPAPPQPRAEAGPPWGRVKFTSLQTIFHVAFCPRAVHGSPPCLPPARRHTWSCDCGPCAGARGSVGPPPWAYRAQDWGTPFLVLCLPSGLRGHSQGLWKVWINTGPAPTTRVCLWASLSRGLAPR